MLADRSLFPFFSCSVVLFGRTSLSHDVRSNVFCGTFFCTCDIRVYSGMLSPSLIRYLLPAPYRKHRKYSTAQSTRATSSKAGTRRSERDNAGKQTELARASMSSSIYIARCVLKTNEEIKICSAYKNIAGRWCDARRVCLYTALSRRPFYFIHTCGV